MSSEELAQALTTFSVSEMSGMVKRALWKTLWKYVIEATITSLIGEFTGVLSCFLLSYLINYIRDPDAPLINGLIYTTIFSIFIASQQLLRSLYYHMGFMTSIRMRRTLVAVIFDKVTKLSMKSLIATNSGKLISVISSDLFAIERSLSFSPLLITFPFVNILTYLIIGFISSWTNSAIVFVCWILMLSIQLFNSRMAKRLKMKDSI